VIVLGYYAVAGAFGLVAVLVPNALAKIILWLLLVVAVIALLWWLSRRAARTARLVPDDVGEDHRT
jgi:uncharacterized membrane protein